MPNIASRLNAVEQSLQRAKHDEFNQRAVAFSKLIENKQVTEADITRLVPEWVADLERDIIREALWLRRHIDAGTTPTIRGDVGALAAIIAIPPDVAVPDVLLEGVRADRNYLTTNLWERPEPLNHLPRWLRTAFYLAALGPDDGHDLRIRFHTGHFPDLSADDRRALDNFDDNSIWHRNKTVTDALISAATRRPTPPAAKPPRPPEDLMRLIV